MKKKEKVICLYQVIMHYRIPFYQRLANDKDFDFKLIYGENKKGSKFKNSDFDKDKIQNKKLWNFFIGQFPITPFLLFFLIKERPDVIFTEGSSSIFNSSIAFLYAKVFRKRIMWWSLGKVENRVQSKGRKLISFFENFIEKRVDSIFTYSSRGKEYFLKRGVKSDKIFVGVNVINEALRIKESLVINESQEKILKEVECDSRFKVGFIGTVNKGKNIELLLESIKSLNKTYENSFVGVVIGDGVYLDELKKEYNSEAFYLGRINVGAVKVLEKCDVMVLPGLGGLAMCDGMLAKLPIITGIADGTEYDLIQDGKNGFIEKSMTIDVLSNRLLLYYKNENIKYEHGIKSFRLITEKNSFNNYYNVWKSMFNYVVNK